MFKKVLSSSLALFTAFVILGISLKIACNPLASYAMASLEFSVPPQESSISAKPKVDYYLVYPGILPDHPLYKFKMIRDRVKIMFTQDSLAKANLFLLLADKRVGAGEVLIRGNKVSLGLSTIIKGEKYLERAVSEIPTVKKSGKDTQEIIGRLKKASLKHEEILNGLKEVVNEEGILAIDDNVKFLKLLQQRIDGLAS